MIEKNRKKLEARRMRSVVGTGMNLGTRTHKTAKRPTRAMRKEIDRSYFGY